MTFSLITSGLVLYINYLFDPLWYFSGNRVGEYNVRFNERLSKTNQFLKQPKKYDCFIFGSSRTTLLNENRIQDNNCFNYSFSSGLIAEHLEFSRYVKKWGNTPNLIIVSVGGFNFLPEPVVYSIPDFVKNQSLPSHWLKNYLSLSALKFSIRVWKGGEFSRQYTKDFVGVEVKRLPHQKHKQSWDAIRSILNGKSEPEEALMYSTDNVHFYKKIREVFPISKYIGYVPPISVDRIVLMYVEGKLDGYLRALYTSARLFDQFYDFSNPTHITKNSNNTYDGSHYYPEINDLVIDRIMQYKPYNNFGISVKSLTYDQYYRIYEKAITNVMTEKNLS